MKRLLSVCVIAALSCACGTTKSTSAQIDRAMEAMVPADTVVLAGVKMEALRKTDVWRKIIAEQKVTQLDDLAKDTGLDPRRDLNELLIASNGKSAVMMARGTFPDTAALEAKLEKSGARRTSYKSWTLVGNDQGVVVFLKPGLVVAGQPDAVRAALDQQKLPPARALLDKVATIPAENQVWAIATGGFSPLPIPDSGNLSNLNRIFGSMENTTLTLDLRFGVTLAASGICSTDQDAKRLNDALRGLIGIGRLSTPSDRPDLLKFFDGIRVEYKEKTVRLNADVPMDVLEMFLKLTERRRPA
jgi:hypothetical protein